MNHRPDADQTLPQALTLVRRANLRGRLLHRRTAALLELEWRGAIQWVGGRGTDLGGYWAQPVPRAEAPCAADEAPASRPGLAKCGAR